MFSRPTFSVAFMAWGFLLPALADEPDGKTSTILEKCLAAAEKIGRFHQRTA